MPRFLPAIALCLGALPAMAQDFVPVQDVARFVALVEGRELRLPLYGIKLRLSPDGVINGSALGWGITGSWKWDQGYFCREMDWSGTDIPYNCQLVEVRGTDEIRFTVDRGTGDSAKFKLR